MKTLPHIKQLVNVRLPAMAIPDKRMTQPIKYMVFGYGGVRVMLLGENKFPLHFVCERMTADIWIDVHWLIV